MDETMLKELNDERKMAFKKECDKANAWIVQTHWTWDIDNDMCQMVLYDEKGTPVALWEEVIERVKSLQDRWDIEQHQWIVVGVNRRKGVETYYGVFAIGWFDKTGVFRGVFFRLEDTILGIESELGAPVKDNTMDELDRLDSLGLED